MKQKICYVLFVLLVLLNIYDTYSTNTLLNSGMPIEYEFNPVIRFLIGIFGQLASMVVFKGLALIWIASFIIRASTERMWNILTVGLIVCNCWYAVIMYFMNYKAMLLLGGV